MYGMTAKILCGAQKESNILAADRVVAENRSGFLPPKNNISRILYE